MCDEECKREWEKARAPPVEIPILLNDANIEMGIIERKKEIDNSRKNETRRGKNLILNMCTYASERACVCVCGFFSCVHFQFQFLFLFFGRFLSEEAEQKCYIHI